MPGKLLKSSLRTSRDLLTMHQKRSRREPPAWTDFYDCISITSYYSNKTPPIEPMSSSPSKPHSKGIPSLTVKKQGKGEEYLVFSGIQKEGKITSLAKDQSQSQNI